jgi:2-keto-3-deoxy-L-rhamnonate aldolase RhmA
MDNFVAHARAKEGGLLGTWVKLPTLETVQLLAHAGFDLVVIDLEHAPLTAYRAVEMVFAAQALGMAAIVRLPDHTSYGLIQPLLDGGADGLLVPRVSRVEDAQTIARRMVFAPHGERGLGTTSRAGTWGLGSMQDYVARGNDGCLRMVQLEDWQSLEAAADFAAAEHVNGVFIGHGDLFLSSGKPPSHPDVRALTRRVLDAARAANSLSGASAATPEEARAYLTMGFSIVMVSNDTTLFGKAAAEAVKASRG